MTLLEAIGLAALFSALVWPLTQTHHTIEQKAVATRSHAIAQCAGEVKMRKVQRTCEQMQ